MMILLFLAIGFAIYYFSTSPDHGSGKNAKKGAVEAL